jgi:hypothetical protein
MSHYPESSNRDYPVWLSWLSVAFALAALTFALTRPSHKTTVYQPPATCQHAATATLNHLHALADSVGVHVTIKAIHADMAGLQACR